MAGANPEVTIYSDYVCPFCFLGRESFARVEAERGESLVIDWHPFDLRSHRRDQDGELDPAVTDGKDDAYYERAKQNVRRLQERYEVEMTLDLATDIDSLPAQLASYRLKEDRHERWRAFDEAIFEALWVDGRDISDPAVLLELAADVEIDPDVVASALEDADLRGRLFKQFEEAHRDGVTGVPTFVYDEVGVRGAVPPAQLRRLVEGAGRP